MGRIGDEECPLFSTIPAPRVLQNQLDRKVESYIVLAGHKLLKEGQKAMLRAKASECHAIFVAVILHVTEMDVWRSLAEHWLLHPEVSCMCLNVRAYDLGNIKGDHTDTIKFPSK